tara:strand:+ start:305 stop:523 length:219 start_codon:yes stop_codon:yes gene_type:complete
MNRTIIHLVEASKKITGTSMHIRIPFWPTINDLKDWDVESFYKDKGSLVIRLEKKQENQKEIESFRYPGERG